MDKNLNHTVGVLEVGFGNLPSLKRILRQIDVSVHVIRNPSELVNFGHVIVPGVGAFGPAMTFLEQGRFVDALFERCLRLKKPTLGICLGAQIFLETGFEGGERSGVGIFKGRVVKASDNFSISSLHNGWDVVEITRPVLDFNPGLRFDAYFNHEYVFHEADVSEICAISDYRGVFPVILSKEKTFAVQFHPEKSQSFGMQIIKSFLRLQSV